MAQVLRQLISLDDASSSALLMIRGEVGMKRIFGNFDHFRSLHESASHATSSASSCQQAIVGRAMMLDAIGQSLHEPGKVETL